MATSKPKKAAKPRKSTEAALQTGLLDTFTTGLLAEAKVGEKGDVINDVAILGRVSDNGRIYPDAVREAAIPLFEGAKVCIAHPYPADKNADPRDIGGSIHGIYMDKSDPNRPMLRAKELRLRGVASEEIKKCASEISDLVGISVRAGGMWKRNKDGMDEVTEIKKVVSVDIVSDPAATRNLYESIGQDVADLADKDFIRRVISETWQRMDNCLYSPRTAVACAQECAEYMTDAIESLSEKFSDSESADSLGVGDTETGTSENTDMDIKELTVEAIRKDRPDLIEAIEKPLIEAKTKAEADLATMKANIELAGKISEALDKAKVPAAARTEIFIESLRNAGDDAKRAALIEDRMKLVGAQAPTSREQIPPFVGANGGTAAGEATRMFEKLVGTATK